MMTEVPEYVPLPLRVHVSDTILSKLWLFMTTEMMSTNNPEPYMIMCLVSHMSPAVALSLHARQPRALL